MSEKREDWKRKKNEPAGDQFYRCRVRASHTHIYTPRSLQTSFHSWIEVIFPYAVLVYMKGPRQAPFHENTLKLTRFCFTGTSLRSSLNLVEVISRRPQLPTVAAEVLVLLWDFPISMI